MRLVRWQPFSEMESLRDRMDRMFDELAGINRQSSTNWTPAIEIQDREDALVLRAEIPGVEAKDLDIQVAREAVAISGEHRYENKAQEQGFFRTELRYGSFQRTIPLPVAVENNQVQAEFKDGILKLTLPKAQEARHKVVKVNLGEDKQETLPSTKTDNQNVSPQETASSNN
ncbi:MAG: Hsp20/alpha crystallin family protein [Chroococcus sp. CMT-3BRIN-NPC107]|jgi:HSP20 family protein|nr:Hsp20/alpha crystallin family protein [Chroococcus sp. CMT-3BRIN-NPC107]